MNGHKLALETFVATSHAYESLIEAFNRELFGGSLQYKIYVFPPEAGSFKNTLGVVLIAGFSALIVPAIGEIGLGFFTSLTGKPPVEWGEQLGEDVREQLMNLRETEEDEYSSDEETDSEVAILTEMLVRSSGRFLEASTKELSEINIDPETYPDMFDSKNSFFETLLSNPQISGIELGEEPSRPIPNTEFGQRVAPVRHKEKFSWEFETTKILATSPNWDKNDRHRGWKGRDNRGATIHFTILDTKFWTRFENHQVHSETIDELVVQLATKIEDGRRKARFVLNVISYNDERFSTELNAEQLAELLEALGLQVGASGEEDLFD